MCSVAEFDSCTIIDAREHLTIFFSELSEVQNIPQGTNILQHDAMMSWDCSSIVACVYPQAMQQS